MRVAAATILAVCSIARAADYKPLDEMMARFMADNRVPGAALAVARDGEVVYEKGFGEAAAGSRFRIASLSKPITAVAVLQLVEQGKLSLDDPALKYITGLPLDERWRKITIRHLLTHTAGFDRDKSYDPMFRVKQMSATRPADVIRYMLGQKLDFGPGERYAYSNFGYCVLGRIIERVTGLSYEAYVRARVLHPIGVEGMRVGAAAGEVQYHLAGKPYTVDIMDAHGGWVASAGEMVRFAAGVEKLLKKESIQEMFRRQVLKGDGPVYYGLGWQVREVGPGRINTWHTGLLDGACSIMVRRWDGWSWVVLMNADLSPDGKRDLIGKIDPLVHRAVARVR